MPSLAERAFCAEIELYWRVYFAWHVPPFPLRVHSPPQCLITSCLQVEELGYHVNI